MREPDMVATIDSTPRRDGFRMPGEFEAHAGCWMLWPERTDNWRVGARPAQQAFKAVAEAIADFEPITVGVSREQCAGVRRLLRSDVRVAEMSCDDSWMRDCGPTFVVNDEGVVRGVDWEFNAWGGLDGGAYFPCDQDALVARRVLEMEGLDRYKAQLVMEGGSIHVDGEGTLLTTEECLLNPNRNPHLRKAEIEKFLAEYLNVEKIIWLGRGVPGDGTSGHVDNLCCFIRPGVVALTWTDDASDSLWDICNDAYERLSTATDAKGRQLEVHIIHQPGPLYRTKAECEGIDVVEGSRPRREGDRLPASYANFYIANGAVVVPTFGDPRDEDALETLQRLFPQRKAVGVPSREILLGGGNIHCIVQQQPRSQAGPGRWNAP